MGSERRLSCQAGGAVPVLIGGPWTEWRQWSVVNIWASKMLTLTSDSRLSQFWIRASCDQLYKCWLSRWRITGAEQPGVYCLLRARESEGEGEREREDKGDRSKTPQSGRQTFDRGALWFASFIFRTPLSSRIIMRQMHWTPAAWVATGMGGQKHSERVQTCTSRLVWREVEGGWRCWWRGNERWWGCLGVWEIPHSPQRGELAHRS